MYRSTLVTAGLASCLTFAGVAQAQPPAGRLLASQCAQCHGTNGAGPGFDEIAGESANEIYGEMLEMKNSSRIESIMDRQAHGYTNAQIQLIANYLASQSGGSGSGGSKEHDD